MYGCDDDDDDDVGGGDGSGDDELIKMPSVMIFITCVNSSVVMLL